MEVWHRRFFVRARPQIVTGSPHRPNRTNCPNGCQPTKSCGFLTEKYFCEADERCGEEVVALEVPGAGQFSGAKVSSSQKESGTWSWQLKAERNQVQRNGTVLRPLTRTSVDVNENL